MVKRISGLAFGGTDCALPNRERTGIPARLDVVGFDTATPQVIADFGAAT